MFPFPTRTLLLSYLLMATARALRGPIVLGSKSFTRRLILEEMGFSPIVVRTADIDEQAIGDRSSDPADLVLLLGREKADALLPTLQGGDGDLAGARHLVTGDQVVVHNGRILEKPANLEEVRANIRSYGKSPCQTIGSAVVTDLKSLQRKSGVDTATIYFKEFDDATIEALCREPMIMHCAGGLMIEHPLVEPFIERIQGSISSVMGLSKELVAQLVDELDGMGESDA